MTTNRAPISTYTADHLGGYHQENNIYDFFRLRQTRTYHRYNASADEVKMFSTHTYTPQERPLETVYKVNMGTDERIVTNGYDDLGQLIQKQVGQVGTGALQHVDYKYNIRGWLTDINDVDPGHATGDLFSFRINYDTVQDDLDDEVSPLYNGNISETFWKSASDGFQRKYGYKYDGLNRLLRAYYQRPYEAVPLTRSYDEWMAYDRNGNITSLSRNGDYEDLSGALRIDDLVYTYEPKSNKLVDVDDLEAHASGFNDGNTGDDYGYDTYGNMTHDKNKDIGLITYNHLNLPLRIQYHEGSFITYQYNAAGTKVRKLVSKQVGSNQEQTTTVYQQGFQYENSTLQFIAHPEGYIKATKVENTLQFNYVYQYKDHLGNIRMNYALDPSDNQVKILNEDHYYPFGLKHTNYNSNVKDFQEDPGFSALKIIQVPSEGNTYRYKYQSQEWQDELGLGWYSFKWRNYDPAIARFMSIDPLTESYEDYTPYQFASNQPVHAQEVEGLENSHDLNKRIVTRETHTVVRDNIPQTDRRVASTVRSVAAEGAYTGIKTNAVRSAYNAAASKLDVSDNAGRKQLKVDAREKMPAVTKAVLEANRPIAGEMTKVGGTANKTNVGVTETAGTLGKVGTGLAVVGAVSSGYNIATADNKVEATAEEAGAWAGAIYGGEAFGTAGATFGPWGAGIGAVVGSIIGGIAGKTAVQGTIDAAKTMEPLRAPIDPVTNLPVPPCFIAGTKVTMSDFAQKNIEDVKNGDFIQTFNTETNTVEVKEVLLVESSKSDYFVEIEFEDGTLSTNTLSHPYYILNKGWSSYDSNEAFKKYSIAVGDLKEGDYVYKLMNNGTIQNIKIVKIKLKKMTRKTYNLSNVKDDHDFFANGILVHNRS